MRTLPLLIILLLLCCSTATAAFTITGVCPDTWYKGEGDEYIIITGTGSLTGVSVSDGEGSARFPDGERADGNIVVAQQAEAYRTVHGVYPDYEWYDSTPAVPDLIRTGTLKLGNSGDEVILRKGRTETCRVTWPGDVVCREGQVHYFEDGVWDPRPLMIGQSRFAPVTFTGVSGTAFAAPDASREMLLHTIRLAEDELLINVYEFADPGIAADVAAARDDGVTVTLLLEGGPVGGISAEETEVAAYLRNTGAAVYTMETTDAAHARYRYDHAKYLIADREAVLVVSENFKASGFPERGDTGNRGWGVLITDPRVADYFADVFTADVGGEDIVPFTPVGTLSDSDDKSGVPYQPDFGTQSFSGATVTPVFAPDTASLIPALIKGAEQSVDIQQAYISNWTKNAPNPYLEAAVDAARRGVTVRIILDSYWFNTEGENDNDEMAARINAVAAAENLPLEARLACLGPGYPEKVHNKGVIVDGDAVLISSINWNENSPSFNREAGVIIEDDEVGTYFSEVFTADWVDAGPISDDEGNPVDDTRLRQEIAAGVVGLFCIGYIIRRWRR
ncbi:phospholipase D-like domain-containing protein [Methanogenium organophilum]|uniref:Phospholipase D-like domain-containing protein n=1 Tax=Methanogenium organophilum TaxID=2199 RepID=A0A9X9S1I2_METOG|nr:phospholipase D-like domain-containing protein [Methanogenium organophilum]WAI00153.1 phospholipase D-like domain-containing protein [Methanogenium organophilum]